MPRDGRFIEKLGTYNPLLPKDREDRVRVEMTRIQYWLDRGAQPTDRVSRMLEAAGVLEKRHRNNPKKAQPHRKALERAEERAARVTQATEVADEVEVDAEAEVKMDDAPDTEDNDSETAA